MTAPMLAITVHQPYASLIALKIKTLETDRLPPHGTDWDHLTAPSKRLPGPKVAKGERIAIHAAARGVKLGTRVGPWHAANSQVMWRLTNPGIDYMQMPLGAVVCTAVLADVLPVVGCDQAINNPNPPERPYIIDTTNMGGTLVAVTDENPRSGDRLTDQLPYGRWTPGTFAWQLTDVEPCDPVPAKGRQGVWRWEP